MIIINKVYDVFDISVFFYFKQNDVTYLQCLKINFKSFSCNNLYF